MKKILLIAEDNDDHYFLTQEAFEEADLAFELHRVRDGEQLMHYLFREKQYKALINFPLPTVILLDLNMPKVDGREALQQIKNCSQLNKIPVLVLTTSSNEEDHEECREQGVIAFKRKPTHFRDYVTFMKQLSKFL